MHEMIIYMYLLESVPRYFSSTFGQFFCSFFYKNTHTCEISAVEIIERNNFQDNFIDTLSSFIWKNTQERKQIPLEF